MAARLTARYRREFHDHDTSARPEIKTWVDHTIIPVKTAADWTLGAGMVATNDANLVLTAAAHDAVALLPVPGICKDHLYKVTITVDSIDGGELDVVLGGAVVGSLTTAATVTFFVQATSNSNELTITVDNPALTITATISSIIIEAQEPIDSDLWPVL
jgi:hypothetical protein